jgi:hypothetical protein
MKRALMTAIPLNNHYEISESLFKLIAKRVALQLSPEDPRYHPVVVQTAIDVAVALPRKSLHETKQVGKHAGLDPASDFALQASAEAPRHKQRRASAGKTQKKRLKTVQSKFEKDLIAVIKKYRAGGKSMKWLRGEGKRLLTTAYTDAYKLGMAATGMLAPRTGKKVKGKRPKAELTAEDKKWIASSTKKELIYLNRLLGHVIEDNVRGNLPKRIKAYSQTVGSVYDASRIIADTPMVVIHWVLETNRSKRKTPKPCPDCQLLHKLSPFTKYTLPTTPKAGLTRCLSNCLCRLRIIIVKRTEVEKIKRKNKSADFLIRKVQRNRRSVSA